MHLFGPSSHRRGVLQKLVAVVTAVTMSAAAAACSGGGPDADAGAKTLNMGATVRPVSLNPILNQGNPESLMVMQLAYDPLLRVKPDGTFEPALASAWRWADKQNKKFEMTIRPDAMFSDGTPVTADAVVKSLLAFRDGKGPNAVQAKDFVDVSKTGDDKVVVSSRFSDPSIPLKLAQVWGVGLIVAPGGLDKFDTLAAVTDGAGPYMLDPATTQAGTKYTYVPNPHYYDKSRVKYDKITYNVVSDLNALLSGMRTGTIDYFPGDPATAKSATDAGYRIFKTPMLATGLRLYDRAGSTSKALADPKVRLALEYGIDRQKISDALGYGFTKPWTQLMAPGVQGYSPDFENYYTYDPEKAKRLLAEAGYPDGFTATMLLVQLAGGVTALAQAIAAQLEEIGVKFEITLVPQTEASTQIATLKYAFGGGSFCGSTPPRMCWEFYMGPQSFTNPQHIQNEQAQALFDKGAAAPGVKQQDELYHDAVKYLLDNVNWTIPALLQQQSYFVGSDRITGDDGGVYAYPNPAFFAPAADK